MGSKKRGKQVVSSNTTNDPTSMEASIDPSMMEACKKIFVLSIEGKHEQAMKRIGKACDGNKTSGFVHRVQAEIFAQAARENKIPKLVEAYLSKATESARKAVTLSRNSIEFSQFYLLLLLRIERFQEVIEEGERALGIQNPIDPATHDFTDPEEDFQTPEDRIGFVRLTIRELVHQCKNPLGKTPEEIYGCVSQARDTVSWRKVRVRDILFYPDRQLREEQKMVNEVLAGLTQAFDQNLVESQKVALSPSANKKLQRVWNSLSSDQKQDLLKVDVSDLSAYCSSSKYRTAKMVLSEAVTFYKENNKWDFWRCCLCNDKFPDSELHYQHIVKIHAGGFLPKNLPAMPEELDKKWRDMIFDGTWKPVDATAVISRLQDKWKQSTLDEDCSDRVQEARDHLLKENWHPVNDLERTTALELIQKVLKFFSTDDFISGAHVNMLSDYSMKRLEGLLPDSRFWKHVLAQTHLCICSLGMSDLMNILRFLDDISKVPYVIADEKDQVLNKIQKTTRAMEPDIDERIMLRENSLFLLGSNSSQPNDDAIPELMSTSQLSEEQLQRWKDLEKEREKQGKKLQMILKENIQSLQDLCSEQIDLSSSWKAFQAVWDELRERKHRRERGCQSFETILQKQQEEIAELGQITETDRLKLEFISGVLNDSESTDYTQGQILAPIPPRFCIFSISEDCDEADNRVREAMQTVDKSIGLKGIKIDMQLMRAMKESRGLDYMITPLAASDYRTILLPLMKSYILAKLEKHANERVAEEVTVVKETNQAFALDSRKRPNRGNEPKQIQKERKKKPKQNKKNKKDSKDNKEHNSLSYHAGTDGHSDLESTEAISDADLKREDERLRCQMEEDARKLQENVEKELKMLDDIKLRHLAQKHTQVTVTGAAQLEDTPGLTATTTENTVRSSNLSDGNTRVRELTQTTSAAAGASTNNFPITAHQTEASISSTSNLLNSDSLHFPSRCDIKDSRKLAGTVQAQTKMEDDFNQTHPVKKQREGTVRRQDKMVTEVAQEEDIPQLTATTTENTSSTDVGLGQPTQTTAGASIDNVPVARHQAEAGSDVGLGQQIQSTAAPAGGSVNNVPVARHRAEAATSSSSDLVPDDPLEHPALSGVIGLQGCSGGAASMLLSLRFEAAMESYNDPSTEPSERPVMYSEPEVDFLAELQRAIRLFKEKSLTIRQTC